MTACALSLAKAIERLRGPSARFASLGMTRVRATKAFAAATEELSPLQKKVLRSEIDDGVVEAQNFGTEEADDGR
jgi:hypothetical protein